ncbi:PIN domain-containing protein [Candidatus Gottesmanbacteria bacterium]|nr:PIN domain-containing protein [Candidatus Gottesmanbacteria bacterium]MBI5465042.1 PIN domain-containing protein [Candidatus Gottesmanbacteria bacterium]
MAKVVDANIIIRYLVGDSPLHVAKIKKLIQEDKEKLILTDVAIAEIVWVLESYYEQEKEEIAEKILSLLEVPIFMINKSVIARAIHHFQEYNIDYIDAYLISYAQETKALGVLSFDKSIDRVKATKRFEP